MSDLVRNPEDRFSHDDAHCILNHLFVVGRCQSLRELSILKCDRLSDRTISDIIQHCPVIENLTLVGSLSLGYVLLYIWYSNQGQVFKINDIVS